MAKTLRSRIAAVAVVALGAGLIQAAPAFAADEYTSTTTISASSSTKLTGYTAGSVATVTGVLAAQQLGSNLTASATLTARQDVTYTIAGATGGADDVAVAAALKFVESATTATANLATNGKITALGGCATLTTTGCASVSLQPNGSYATASANLSLYLAAGLAAGTSGTAVITVAKTATSLGNGAISVPVRIKVTVGNPVAGTATLSPATGLATVTAGGSAVMTVTQPYTALANTAWTERTFTLAGTATGQTFSVSAVTTGGSTTLVRVDANNIRADVVKNALDGAFSVTYTITVNAPLSATAGQTITVDSFTATVQPYTPTYTSSTSGLVVANTGYYEPTGDNILWAAAASTLKSADVTITQKDQFGQTITQPAYAKTVTATITGKGALLAVAGADVIVKSQTFSVANGTLLSGTTGITVFSDGTAGEGTLSIAVDGVVVKTYTMRFYGDAAKVTATVLSPIGVAGTSTTRGAIGNAAAANGGTSTVGTTTVTAIKVTVTDSNGWNLPTTAPVAVSATPTVITSAARTLLDSGIGILSAGTFAQHYSFTTAAGSVSGASSAITFNFVNTAGTLLTSAPVTLYVGGPLAKATLKLDKASYNPGEAATLTATGVDAAGNKPYDGQNVMGYGIDSTLDFVWNDTQALSLVNGTKSRSIFAPLGSGTWTVTAYDLNLATASATATVLNPTAAAQAAADAAKAEAAKANTAIAAVAATVTGLQTAMSTLVASVTATLTALTAKINKIMAKLRIK